MGLGGGAAVILAAFWLNKFDMTISEPNKTYLIVLGVVSGFVGHRILPGIALGLEKRLDLTEKEARIALERAEKAVSDAKEATKEAKKAAEDAVKAHKLTDIIQLINRRGYIQAEAMLLELKNRYKLDSSINFTLSNLYNRKEEFDNAISLMKSYIEELRDANKEKDEEFSKALYNRACYQTRKAFSSPPRDDVLIARALDDLEKAADLNPVSKEWAWKDDDFKGLREERNRRFSKIVSREYPELTGNATGLA